MYMSLCAFARKAITEPTRTHAHARGAEQIGTGDETHIEPGPSSTPWARHGVGDLASAYHAPPRLNVLKRLKLDPLENAE